MNGFGEFHANKAKRVRKKRAGKPLIVAQVNMQYGKSMMKLRRLHMELEQLEADIQYAIERKNTKIIEKFAGIYPNVVEARKQLDILDNVKETA